MFDEVWGLREDVTELVTYLGDIEVAIADVMWQRACIGIVWD